MKTKDKLIQEIEKLANNTIDKGILLRTLARSIQERKEEKTLKEWKEQVKEIINTKVKN